MGFKNNAYAKVWEVINEKNDKGYRSPQLRISISRKDKESKYVQDFGGYVSLMGDCKKLVDDINVGDTVKLISVDVSNHYDKDNKATYTYYKVWELEQPDKNEDGSSNNSKANTKVEDTIDDQSEEDLPF